MLSVSKRATGAKAMKCCERALNLSEGWRKDAQRKGTRFFFLCIYPVGLLNTVRTLNGIQTTSET